MAEAASRAMNFFPTLMLRSPLHGVMSGKYLIIEFTGRKSGRVYRTPLAYVQQGDQVLLSTDSAWWRNMTDPAPVTLRLRGRDVAGTATAHPDDAAESTRIIRALVDAIPSYAKPAELEKTDGRVSDAEIARAVAQGRVGITVDLAKAST